MRIKLILFLLSTSSLASAQSFKSDPNYVKKALNDIGYMLDTVVQSNYDKTQLYSNALAYVSNISADSRYNIESKDLNLGEITFSGLVKTYSIHTDIDKKGKKNSYQVPIGLEFKCKAYLKDQKFRIILNTLSLQMIYGLPGINLDPFAVAVGKEDHLAASKTAIKLIRDISKAVNRKPENDF